MIFMKTQSNFYLFLIALISAMGGFLFGYDWVVIGGAKPFYEQYFGIANDPVMQGWAMSSALIGCLFGALSAGKLSDRLGRKPILILAAGLFICTAVGISSFSRMPPPFLFNGPVFISYRWLSFLSVSDCQGLSCNRTFRPPSPAPLPP